MVSDFIFIMSLVSKIQGTARVVNYAGLVRGKTQRIIKLEISGSPQDEMIADIDAFIDGLENGSSQLNLVRLDDPDFQAKMKELDAYFSQLKEEVAQVRMRDYRKTDIIAKSERFFNICDEATGLAEVYSQKKATQLFQLKKKSMESTAFCIFYNGNKFITAISSCKLVIRDRLIQLVSKGTDIGVSHFMSHGIVDDTKVI